MTGTEITRNGVAILRQAGFICRVFNAPRRVATKDWIDVWACRRGESWLIEVKGEGDRLKPSQKEFITEMENHLGPHLNYVLARSVEDFQNIAELKLPLDRSPHIA